MATIKQRIEAITTEVTDAKIGIADAITSKGVETSSGDTFETMEANIRKIETSNYIELSSVTAYTSNYTGFKYDGTKYYSRSLLGTVNTGTGRDSSVSFNCNIKTYQMPDIALGMYERYVSTNTGVTVDGYDYSFRINTKYNSEWSGTAIVTIYFSNNVELQVVVTNGYN